MSCLLLADQTRCPTSAPTGFTASPSFAQGFPPSQSTGDCKDVSEQDFDHDNDDGTARSDLDDEAVAYVTTLRGLHTLRLSQVFFHSFLYFDLF